MNMDRYLEQTLGGYKGKLICQNCSRLMPILTERNGKFVCDLCEKRMEEEDE
jgi:hypothetical protein